MNKRSHEILKLIYEMPNTFTIQSLAERFQISVRTIQNDINYINEFLSKNEISEIKIKNKYLRLDNIKNLTKLLKQLDFYEYTLDRRERLIIEALILMFSEEFITLSQISEIICVSRSTVITDLDYLNRYLYEYNLETFGKPSTGIRLKGDELGVRKLFINIIDSNTYLFKIFLNNFRFSEIKKTNYFRDNKFVFQNIINEVENITETHLSENSYQKLVQYLIFAVYRMSTGNYVNYKKKPSSEFMKKLLELVSIYFKCDFKDDEVAVLEDLKEGFDFIKKTNIDKEVVKVQLLTRQFIEKISKSLKLPLSRDYNFFESLSLHLQRIFLKKYNPIEIQPGIRLIIENNIEVYKKVSKEIYFLENYIGRKLTKAEIYYIIVYVCAAIEKLEQEEYHLLKILIVCNGGIGTIQLLRTRLLEKLDLNIVGVLSSHRIRKNDLEDIDLIISTVDIDIGDIPYVKITPLVDDQDYINLRNALNKVKITTKTKITEVDKLMNRINPIIQNYNGLSEKVRLLISDHIKGEYFKFGIDDFLTEDFIELDLDCDSWQNSVILASQKLLEKGYINENYVESMIKNIEVNGPYIIISQGFALPHAQITDGVYKTSFNIIRLRKPVKFNVGILDPIYFVCVLAAKDKSTHLNAFFELVNLLQINNFKEDLKKVKTKKKFRETILRYKKIIDFEGG